ncbi:MAG: tRNA pseudouridine synthase A [Bacteroidales bacterium]|nr:tRNA pseudouridine synthase A [Bacteroidales bacterium]
MRYKITLSYDGAPFCGWQRQPDAPSVQEALETALQTLLGEPVPVTGAGRTDTGVSAVDYVAHFDARQELDAGHLACKLNAILPVSIAVSKLEPAAPDFHARFDARKRTYTYFLHRCKDPFLATRSYFYGYPEVDFEAMNKAAAMLVGTHDFSCFQKVGSDNKTTTCTVFEAGWQPYAPAGGTLASDPVRGSTAHPSQPGGGAPRSEGNRGPRKSADFWGAHEGGTPLGGKVPPASPQYWFFRISADRFLRNMVRAIVGTLLEVGRGRRSLEEFAALILPPAPNASGAGIAPKNSPSRRCLAGESAPGHALFLTAIEY